MCTTNFEFANNFLPLTYVPAFARPFSVLSVRRTRIRIVRMELSIPESFLFLGLTFAFHDR